MRDFKLTSDGDIQLSPDRFDEHVEGDELKLQTAWHCVQSIKSDWYIDNIGADLESLIGAPFNETTIEEGRLLIVNALTEHRLYSEDEIYIESSLSIPMTLTYDIYLKTEDGQAQALRVTLEDGVEVASH